MDTRVRLINSRADHDIAVGFMRELYGRQGYDESRMQLPEGAASYIFHRGEKIIGVTSILRGEKTLQLEKYFEFSLEAVLPAGTLRGEVMEIARTASVGGLGNMNRFFISLMRVVKKHAEAMGPRYWIAAMKEPLVLMFRKHGWPMEDVPAGMLDVEPGDPMYSYLNTGPPVRIVISSVAESIALAERWLNRPKK